MSLSRGAPVDIYLPGRNLDLRGAVVSYEQSATQTIRQPSLTATGGGPLATSVRAGQSVEDNLRDSPKTEELVEPVVYVIAKPEGAPHLFEGEPCFVRFEGAQWSVSGRLSFKGHGIFGTARQTACLRWIPPEGSLSLDLLAASLVGE